MNKYIKMCFGLSLFLSLFFVWNIVDATVGGPTYINNFKYNPKNESVYYIKYDHGGRGCPPVLEKISLVDGKVEKIYSCEQGEKILNIYRDNEYSFSISKVSEEINKITSSFKDLTPINLNKNNIDIDLQFIKSEKYDSDPEYIKNSVFNTIIYQNKNKVAENLISGCNIEQPFTFAGYAIPGFNKKIVILISTKGNCFEGGYLSESLMVVGGLENLDKNQLPFYKGDEPLIPNEGTLTLYENSDIKKENSNRKDILITEKEDQNEPENKSVPINKVNKFNNILLLGIALVLGFTVGVILKRNKKV